MAISGQRPARRLQNAKVRWPAVATCHKPSAMKSIATVQVRTLPTHDTQAKKIQQNLAHIPQGCEPRGVEQHTVTISIFRCIPHSSYSECRQFFHPCRMLWLLCPRLFQWASPSKSLPLRLVDSSTSICLTQCLKTRVYTSRSKSTSLKSSLVSIWKARLGCVALHPLHTSYSRRSLHTHARLRRSTRGTLPWVRTSRRQAWERSLWL
jgi:hypothetical protein